MTPTEMVKEFHDTYLIEQNVGLGKSEVLDALRVELIREEFEDELLPAVADADVVEVADALADLVYVIYGAALVWDIPLDDVLEEVHRSNMSKLDDTGKPIYREDGKVLKGRNYFAPDIALVLDKVREQTKHVVGYTSSAQLDMEDTLR